VRVSVAAAVIVAFILPATAVIVRAHQLGVDASKGVEVRPFELLGVPVLDVRADSAVMRWVGADKAWPAEPFGEGSRPLPVHVTVLARDGATVTVLVKNAGDRSLCRLNSAQIAIAYE
jgi:predicted membrane chloride channel (bestrophin family)